MEYVEYKVSRRDGTAGPVVTIRAAADSFVVAAMKAAFSGYGCAQALDAMQTALLLGDADAGTESERKDALRLLAEGWMPVIRT